MKTQVQTLVSMMRKGWVSTADAFNAGVTSYHRRLADFRKASSGITTNAEGMRLLSCYLVNGKPYKLQRMTMEIPTRWGKSKIVKYRLVAVK